MSKTMRFAGLGCLVLVIACVIWAILGDVDVRPLKFMLATLIAVCGLSLVLVAMCVARIEALEARLYGTEPEPLSSSPAGNVTPSPNYDTTQIATIGLLGLMSTITTANMALLASRRPVVPPLPVPLIVAGQPQSLPAQPQPPQPQPPQPGTTGAEWWKFATVQQPNSALPTSPPQTQITLPATPPQPTDEKEPAK